MSTDSYKASSAAGWVVFAAAVMLTIGAIDIIQGLAALLKETTYVIPGGEILFSSRRASTPGAGA